MTKLRDVCRNIRSKNAGPYWVTIDFFFNSPENYEKYSECAALASATFAAAFSVDASMVKRFRVKDLSVLKVSYPRQSPQGGMIERDMHCGQQYARLLDIEMD